MAILLPENRFSIHDVEAVIQNNFNFMHTEVKCCHCGYPMKIPLMVKDSDIYEIRQFINMLDGFLKNHKEIEQSILQELIDLCIEARNRIKKQ